MKGLEEHKYLMKGNELLKCPFCGGEPYIVSCDRIISIGCERCKFHRPFHGLAQSDEVTDVVITRDRKTGEPIEWYDKDAFQKAIDGWNRREGI